MLDRFQTMQVLLRIAELGSFSAAARALDMSPTMAAKHISGLEKRLGVGLFHRSTRRVTLTAAGLAFRESAERILNDIEALESATITDATSIKGVLRVNAPISFGAREIAPLLRDFSIKYDQLSVDLGLNDRLVDLMEEGWDVAIRVGSLANSSLVARRIAPARHVLCASADYLARNGAPTRVSDLAKHDCLAYTLSWTGALDEWLFGPNGNVRAKVAGSVRSNNGNALKTAAIAGQGLVYLPSFIVHDAIVSGDLTVIHLDHEHFEFGSIYAVYLPTERIPPKIRVFIDFLVEKFSKRTPWDQRDRN